MTLQQRPHNIGLAPTQEQSPRITTILALTSSLGGASKFGTTVTADLVMEDAEGVITNVQTMYVDASKATFPVVIQFLETQQSIFIAAKSQGYYPIAVAMQVQMSMFAWDTLGTDTANVTVNFQFLNVPVAGVIWAANQT
jgi:hypothetical protein